MNPTTSKTRPKNWERIVNFSLSNQNKQISIKSLGHSPQSPGILVRISAFFSHKTGAARKAETVDNLRASLRNFLEFQGREMMHELDPGAFDQTVIEQRITAILDKSGLENSKKLTGEVIAKAHIAAQHEMLALRNEYASKASAPTILPFIKINRGPNREAIPDGYGVCVLDTAPKVANLVLAGGGMKGQGYVGVVKTLENTGIRKDLKHIAGTSAGALTAACLATGMKAEDYAALATKMNMLEEMGDLPESQDKPAASKNGYGQNGASIRMKKGRFAYSADKLFLTCQQTLRDNVSKFRDAHLDKVRLDSSGMTAARKASLRNLHNCIKNEPAYQITFGDLALLHEYDPDNFKRLTLTGFNQTDGTLEVFDAGSWPDLPIATAMRISMAIPVFIDPVILTKNGQDKIMVDGGVAANLPTHLINPYATGGEKANLTDSAEAEMAATSTMVLAFGDDAQKALDRGAGSVQMPRYKRLFAAAFAPTRLKAFRDDAQRFVEAGISLPVHHRGLDTMSFGASKKAISAAQVDAEVRFIDALRRHGVAEQDRVIHRSYKTMDEAVKHIREKDLRAFIESPPAGIDPRARDEFVKAARAHLATLARSQGAPG
jgi:predicted acylesterase/phospholipase RssA